MPLVQCECLQCGAIFETYPSKIKTGRGRYCSLKCRDEAYKTQEQVHCSYCNQLFTPTRNSRKYCSFNCFNEARKNEIEKPCEYCGKLFKYAPSRLKDGEVKYCSTTCYGKAKKTDLTLTCQVCGKEFRVYASNIKNDRKYCSRACYHVAQTNKIEKECEHCGKKFFAHPYELAKGKGRCCSDACSRAIKRTSTLHECKYCGKEISVKPSDAANGKGLYCSRQCNYLDHRGVNNKNWRGGSFYRGGNWSQQRKLARERDGGICQVCKRKPKEGERKFAVHHIKPLRDFNGDHTAANRLDNLITLCHSCHPRVERGMIAVQRRLV